MASPKLCKCKVRARAEASYCPRCGGSVPRPLVPAALWRGAILAIAVGVAAVVGVRSGTSTAERRYVESIRNSTQQLDGAKSQIANLQGANSRIARELARARQMTPTDAEAESKLQEAQLAIEAFNRELSAARDTESALRAELQQVTDARHQSESQASSLADELTKRAKEIERVTSRLAVAQKAEAELKQMRDENANEDAPPKWQLAFAKLDLAAAIRERDALAKELQVLRDADRRSPAGAVRGWSALMSATANKSLSRAEVHQLVGPPLSIQSEMRFLVGGHQQIEIWDYPDGGRIEFVRGVVFTAQQPGRHSR